MKVMIGKHLIMIEAESASKLLYMIDFLIRGTHPDRKKTIFKELMAKYGDGYRVWQELKDSTKAIIDE